MLLLYPTRSYALLLDHKDGGGRKVTWELGVQSERRESLVCLEPEERKAIKALLEKQRRNVMWDLKVQSRERDSDLTGSMPRERLKIKHSRQCRKISGIAFPPNFVSTQQCSKN